MEKFEETPSQETKKELTDEEKSELEQLENEFKNDSGEMSIMKYFFLPPEEKAKIDKEVDEKINDPEWKKKHDRLKELRLKGPSFLDMLKKSEK